MLNTYYAFAPYDSSLWVYRSRERVDRMNMRSEWVWVFSMQVIEGMYDRGATSFSHRHLPLNTIHGDSLIDDVALKYLHRLKVKE